MDKILVLYVFHIYNDRVKYFFENCIFEDKNVDFVLISNNKSEIFKIPKHVKFVLFRENIGYDFGGWSDALLIDNLYNNYWFVYSWLKALNDNKASIPNARNPNDDPKLDDYSTTITVYGLDEYNNNKIKFEYTGAIPVELGGINYNYRDSSEAESTFTFSFFQFQATLI
jgi:hypothetical protein